MANINDVVKGLAQAAANAYDGALDENGDPLELGLKRESGRGIYDKAALDGFKIRFAFSGIQTIFCLPSLNSPGL